MSALGRNSTIHALLGTLNSLKMMLPYGSIEVDAFIEKVSNPKTYLLDEIFTAYKSANSRIDVSVKSLDFPLSNIQLDVKPHHSKFAQI